MVELLLPATDGGVLIQLLVVLVLGGSAIYMTRRHREWQLVTIGATLVILGFFGLRSLH